MFRTIFSGASAFVIAVFVFTMPAFAQTGQIRGVVVMAQADGTKTPVENALIEVYNMEVETGAAVQTKSNKKGEFGLVVPAGKKYAVVVSGPGVAPTMSRNITAGMENLEVVVLSGDGTHYSEAEVREALKKTASEKPKLR